MDPEINEFRFLREQVAKKALPDPSQRARQLRSTARINPDGTESTVKFASGEADGKYLVYPTLFPKDTKKYGSDPVDWMEIPGREALDEARKRDEVFTFNSAEEADAFAKGAWKRER